MIFTLDTEKDSVFAGRPSKRNCFHMIFTDGRQWLRYRLSMRIAYVTTYDAHDPRNWSGLVFISPRHWKGQDVNLDYIGPLQERHSTFFRAKTLMYRKFRRQAFQRDRALRNTRRV